MEVCGKVAFVLQRSQVRNPIISLFNLLHFRLLTISISNPWAVSDFGGLDASHAAASIFSQWSGLEEGLRPLKDVAMVTPEPTCVNTWASGPDQWTTQWRHPGLGAKCGAAALQEAGGSAGTVPTSGMWVGREASPVCLFVREPRDNVSLLRAH